MIIASIKSFSHFIEIESLCDGVVVNTTFSTSVNPVFNDEEISKTIEYATKNNKVVILDISFIFEDKDINDIKDFVLKYKNTNTLFLYTDIGVHQILKECNMQHRGIYDPKTLVTNSYDLNAYEELGMNAVGLSNEIPLEDVKMITDKKNGRVWLKIFGYHQMFYSKRKLISLFAKHKNLDINIDRENTFVKEETRDDMYHIDENKYGTLIYRSYVLSYLRELENIKNIDYMYLDSAFISNEDFNEALRIYSDTINSLIDPIMALDYLNELFMIEDGFMYHDTVYKKEEFK